MRKYIILCGGTESEMPDGYADDLWVYLGSLTIDEDFSIKELPELLYKIKMNEGHRNEAQEIKNTAEHADKIKVIEAENEYVFRKGEIHYMVN